jgi:GntR family transcriptional repressor for pyruvate dehydrogenase complex
MAAGLSRHAGGLPLPIRRTTKIAEVVARSILHEIAGRRLPPGTMLPPESEMLVRYGVARGSLREALRLLEFHGLIRIKPGAGGGPVVEPVRSADFGRMATMYFHVDGATMRELFEARLSLETEMAAYAARSRDPRLLAALRLNLEEAALLDASNDSGTHSSAARGFHDIITGMTGNRILDLMSRAIKDIYVERVRDLEYPPETRRSIHHAHEQIVQAIVEGDDVQAGRLMRAHMVKYSERTVLTNMPGLLDEVIDWR